MADKEPVYADAIMTGVAPVPGSNPDPERIKRIEDAMVDAIHRAMADGIALDSPEMKARIEAAAEHEKAK